MDIRSFSSAIDTFPRTFAYLAVWTLASGCSPSTGVPSGPDEPWEYVLPEGWSLAEDATVYRLTPDDAMDWGPRLGAGMMIADADLDGIEDLFVAAPHWYHPDHVQQGDHAVYVVHWDPGVPADLGNATRLDRSAFAKVRGFDTHSGFGEFMSEPRDLDGDGKPEAIISGWPLTLPLSGDVSVEADHAWSFHGSLERGHSLYPDVPCGDLNGDGHQDLCMAPSGVFFGPIVDNVTSGADLAFQTSGEYIHAGQLRPDGPMSVITGFDNANDQRGRVLIAHTIPDEPPDPSTYPWVAIEGQLPGDKVGNWISTGDFDGDGEEDLFIASILRANHKGTGFIWFDTETSGSLTDAPVKIHGSYEGDLLGRASAVGDFDGDGFDDLAIGLVDTIFDGNGHPGRVAVFRGPIAPGEYSVEEADVTWVGSLVRNDGFGTAMAAGDLDGDGRDELAVGAPWDLQVEKWGGAAYVIDDVLEP